MANQDEGLDVSKMLNQDLADVPDLPDFVTPKVGAYQVEVVEAGSKEVNEKAAIEIKYKVISLEEGGDSELGDDCKPGDQFSQLYFFTTAKGAAFNQGVLKKLLAPVAERFHTRTLTESLEKLVGCECVVVVKHQQDQKDASRVYTQVAKLELV